MGVTDHESVSQKAFNNSFQKVLFDLLVWDPQVAGVRFIGEVARVEGEVPKGDVFRIDGVELSQLFYIVLNVVQLLLAAQQLIEFVDVSVSEGLLKQLY